MRRSPWQVDVAYVAVDQNGRELCETLEAQLTAAERAHAGQMLRTEDRVLFAASRALLRVMLNETAGSPAGGWRFRQDTHGKPVVDGVSTEQQIHFNISHTEGMIAVAVCRDCEVGVDVEYIGRDVDFVDTARLCFPLQEQERLQREPDLQQRRELFYSAWTVQEAILKAQGLGLAAARSTRFSASNAPSSSSLTRCDQGQWSVWQSRPSPDHVLAIAVRSAEGQEVRCTQRRMALEYLYARTLTQ